MLVNEKRTQSEKRERLYSEAVAKKESKYYDIATELYDLILYLRNDEMPRDARLVAADKVFETLVDFSLDDNLSHLIGIYIYDEADNVIGYEAESVSKFVDQMLDEYQGPVLSNE